jgi:hypothetical protein
MSFDLAPCYLPVAGNHLCNKISWQNSKYNLKIFLGVNLGPKGNRTLWHCLFKGSLVPDEVPGTYKRFCYLFLPVRRFKYTRHLPYSSNTGTEFDKAARILCTFHFIQGKVDVRCVMAASGGKVFSQHLPLLGRKQDIGTPRYALRSVSVPVSFS